MTRYRRYTSHTMRSRIVHRLALIPIGLCLLGGCQRALFPKDSPRNQYQTYDRMRNKDAPLTEPDVFGNPQPALRARLSQSR